MSIPYTDTTEENPAPMQASFNRNSFERVLFSKPSEPQFQESPKTIF